MGENPFASEPIKLMIGGEVVEANIGKLTFAEDPDLKGDTGEEWKPLSEKQWDIECNALVSADVTGLLPPMDDISLEITQQPGKMPRKMKKAYKSDHDHKTKWGRKVQNYLKRNTFRQEHAKMRITEQDNDTMTYTITFEKGGEI